MTHLRTAPPLAASAVLAFALLVTGRASAASSCAVVDCADGFVCREVTVTDCAAAAPACPPNTECDPVEPEPCQAQTQAECVPAPCSADADCAAGMVCHEWTKECPSVDCACAKDAPDCDCAAPACEPETAKLCTPKYLLPCTAAADCGMGFSCEQLESCGCSGSSGSGGGADPVPPSEARPLPPDGAAGAPADEPGDPLPPDCSCEPSGEFACVPQDIGCDTDAECPAGWTCVAEGNVSTPDCAGDGCGFAPEPEPQPSVNHCQPKYYGGGGGVDEDLGTPTAGGDPKGGGTGTQNPEAAPNDGQAEANDSSACQMGRAPASRGAFGIVLLLGALFGLSRRRAQPRASSKRWISSPN